MHGSASRRSARLIPLVAALVVAIGVGCGHDPQRPAPLEDEPPAANNAPDDQPDSEPSPTPTDGDTGTDPTPDPADGPSSPPGPTWLPEEIPEGEDPPGKPVNVCALITKDEVKKAYGFSRADARPGPAPTTLPATYSCAYQGFKGKTPFDFGAVVTPEATEPDAQQAVEVVTSGKGKEVGGVGDQAVFVPLAEGRATQSDQLVAVAKTDRGLSRVILDAPPGTGVTAMVPLTKKALGAL